MRLVSFSKQGQTKIGYRKNDTVIDLSQIDDTIGNDIISILQGGQKTMQHIASCVQNPPENAILKFDDLTLLPAVPRPPKIICIGRNYAAHALEGGAEPPSYPEIFYRGSTSLVAHNQPIMRPKCSDKLDFEAELAVVIGKTARHVKQQDALSYIGGYTLFNDATLRDYQRKSSQWTIGKNFDGTGALGPDIVTPDEVPEGGHGLAIKTRLNGEIMQDANTKDFIFPIPDIIEKLSECMTLEVGDVIATGTPQGVGYARKPPVFMKHGDICQIEIQGIGILENPIQDEI